MPKSFKGSSPPTGASSGRTAVDLAHITVRRGDRKSQIPMHGGGKELGKGLVQKILKDLGLK
jgi:hypothetical protein